MSEITSIVAVIGSIIAATASILGVYLKIRSEKPHFTIRRGSVPTSLVGVTRSEIYISNPTKPIDKCKVLYNDTALYANVTPDFQWCSIPIGGSMSFHIPRGEFDGKGKIVVKSGRRTLLKTKVSDIPYR